MIWQKFVLSIVIFFSCNNSNQQLWEYFSPENSYAPIRQIVIENNELSFAGTYGDGLYKIKDKKWSSIPGTAVNDYILCLKKTSHGLIAGTAKNGLYLISDTARRTKGFCDANVWAAAENSDSQVIAGSRYGGLSILENDSIHCLPDIKLREITVLEKDSRNRIWLGTASNGLYLWPLDTSNWLNRKTGLSGNTIRALICDTAPKFIGTWDGGFDYRNAGGWKHSKEIPPPVTALGVSPEGTLFVGTWGHGLFIQTEGGWKSIQQKKSGLPDNHIIDIQFDSLGSVYLATNKGVARYFYNRDTQPNTLN